MKLSRAVVALFILAGVALAPLSKAQEKYPSKPIRIIVPYSSGTPPDVVTRIVGAKMGAALGQPIVIDNRPGATGTVGMSELMRQPADGYTFMTILAPMTVAPALYPTFQFDFKRDLSAVGQFTAYYNVLVVNPAVPARTVSELAALIKAKPGEFNFASGGNGTPAHLAGELFKQQASIGSVHVPYNQFPQAIGDLLQGRVQFMFVTTSVIIPHIQSGAVRAIAVTGPKRIAALPDVPTMIESGFKDFDVSGWDGLVARSGTPPEMIARINQELHKAMQSPEVIERFTALAVEPVIGSTKQLDDLIASESQRWGTLVRTVGIKIE